MIDQPISQQIIHAIGEAHGPLAAWIVLDILSNVFDEFSKELFELECPELGNGYAYTADWLQCWKNEIDEYYE